MNMHDTVERIADEAGMLALGRRLAATLAPGMVVFLEGPLGAGKTTLVRGILRALGHEGLVRSPTYALVESYPNVSPIVHHFDLYRLGSAEELEDIGARDYFSGDAACLIEWPERAAGFLPAPDWMIEIAYDNDGRRVRVVATTKETKVAHDGDR